MALFLGYFKDVEVETRLTKRSTSPAYMLMCVKVQQPIRLVREGKRPLEQWTSMFDWTSLRPSPIIGPVPTKTVKGTS